MSVFTKLRTAHSTVGENCISNNTRHLQVFKDYVLFMTFPHYRKSFFFSFFLFRESSNISSQGTNIFFQFIFWQKSKQIPEWSLKYTHPSMAVRIGLQKSGNPDRSGASPISCRGLWRNNFWPFFHHLSIFFPPPPSPSLSCTHTISPSFSFSIKKVCSVTFYSLLQLHFLPCWFKLFALKHFLSPFQL